jgi:hypothetical protein
MEEWMLFLQVAYDALYDEYGLDYAEMQDAEDNTPLRVVIPDQDW